MPRRKKEGLKRQISADPRYGSQVIEKLINVIMWRGKKNAARHIVYEALDIIAAKHGNGDKNKALDLFFKAMEQLIPLIEVKPRRVGGSVYQIPTEVNEDRGRALAMRWLIGAAKERSNKTMGQRLADELREAAEGRGGAFKKKLDVHRMAEANRAFSHYAW
jgi:small subunit ribosomal protein S7